ncbi:Lysine histidine transporter 1, partial [Sarracenia purpurea var. burkii]
LLNIAWSASLHKGVQKDVHYGYTTKSTAGEVFNFFSALGVVAFVYAGHSVALPLFTRDCRRMSIMGIQPSPQLGKSSTSLVP